MRPFWRPRNANLDPCSGSGLVKIRNQQPRVADQTTKWMQRHKRAEDGTPLIPGGYIRIDGAMRGGGPSDI